MPAESLTTTLALDLLHAMLLTLPTASRAPSIGVLVTMPSSDPLRVLKALLLSRTTLRSSLSPRLYPLRLRRLFLLLFPLRQHVHPRTLLFLVCSQRLPSLAPLSPNSSLMGPPLAAPITTLPSPVTLAPPLLSTSPRFDSSTLDSTPSALTSGQAMATASQPEC